MTRALREAVADRPGTFVIYGGSAGPGLLTELGDAVDGLFLGRFAHDPDALVAVLDEAAALAARKRRDRRGSTSVSDGRSMIGLGTYAFFWQHSDRAPAPLSLIDAFETTRELGVDLFQICDYAPLETMDDAELADAAAAARDLGLTIELGTKGIEPEHLARFLRARRDLRCPARAQRCSTDLLRARRSPRPRSGCAPRCPPTRPPDVTLALETYEQVATADLVALVERGRHRDRLGVCLDPGERRRPPRVAAHRRRAGGARRRRTCT